MRRFNTAMTSIGMATLAGLAALNPAHAGDETLKIYLLFGQSNMVGEAYAWDNFATDPSGWNVPTLEHIANNPAYLDSLPNEVYSFKEAFHPNWLDTPRDDAWATHYDSQTGANNQVRNTEDTSPGNNSDPAWPSGIQPLSVGFGHLQSIGSNQDGTSLRPPKFGIEVGMGHSMGNAMDSPLMFFKSSRGGTTLAEDWRPPSAVANRGGTLGNNYTNTMNNLIAFLNNMDQQITNGTFDDAYDGATGYEVAGLIWLQGFNEVVESGGAFIPEYDENLVDLVNDIRAADPRIPADLPVVVAESSDQNASLNLERQAAVDALNAATPGSAVFLETNGLKDVNYGGLNSSGGLFTNGYGYHFHARAENFLEIGYRVGDTILDNGFTGSENLLVGDFDGDGDIDGVDISIMFSNFNGPGGGVPTNPDTDLDGDGDADGVDVSALFALFTGPLTPANVPEPTSLVLLGIGGALISRRRGI